MVHMHYNNQQQQQNGLGIVIDKSLKDGVVHIMSKETIILGAPYFSEGARRKFGS
jgi:hypothetical protein